MLPGGNLACQGGPPKPLQGQFREAGDGGDPRQEQISLDAPGPLVLASRSRSAFPWSLPLAWRSGFRFAAKPPEPLPQGAMTP